MSVTISENGKTDVKDRRLKAIKIAGNYHEVEKSLGLLPEGLFREAGCGVPKIRWVDTSDCMFARRHLSPDEIARQVAVEKARRLSTGFRDPEVIGVMIVVSSVGEDGLERVLLTDDRNRPPALSGELGKVSVGTCLYRKIPTQNAPFSEEKVISLPTFGVSFFRFREFGDGELEDIVRRVGIPDCNPFSSNLERLIDPADLAFISDFLITGISRSIRKIMVEHF